MSRGRDKSPGARERCRRRPPGRPARQTPPVAADGREKLRAQDGADAGDALDYVSEFVFAKPAFGELVQLGDLLVEGHHLPGRGRDYRVVYTVEDGQPIVWVLAVGNRRDIYRQVP